MKLAKRIYYKIRKIIKGKKKTLPYSINGKEFIFVHINKTGGTSITKALGLSKKRHLTCKMIINQIGNKSWDSCFSFTVVRNPWDKVVSHYSYRCKTNQTQMKEIPISFEEWVTKTYGSKKDPFYYDNPVMFQPQLDWLEDQDGKIRVSKIIRFENLREGFDQVKKTLEISTNLPHLNQTKRRNYQKYYNDNTKKIVADWFARDIEYFSYSF